MTFLTIFGLMAYYDTEDRIWKAEDPLLPRVSVLASTREQADRDLRVLRALKQSGLLRVSRTTHALPIGKQLYPRVRSSR